MFCYPAKLGVKQPKFRKYFMVLALTLLTCQIGLAQADSGWRDPSKHRVQFVTVEDGVRLEVLDWGGSGRPVVLLAGLHN
jgi:non-heme chloroperoxidase